MLLAMKYFSLETRLRYLVAGVEVVMAGSTVSSNTARAEVDGSGLTDWRGTTTGWRLRDYQAHFIKKKLSGCSLPSQMTRLRCS